jgi:ABC-type Fe3+/spermidine/putrescine transport system ATPase subunit
MNGLEINNIHKAYVEKGAVLTGVSFSMRVGEVLAILGPSGCGKSTLLSIIAGLIEPDRGSVRWKSQDLNGVPPHRRGFGLMFQDYALFPHMRVRDNVAFGLRMQGLARDEIDERVKSALALVGLPGYEDRDVNTLSGGEQQRVALARALAPKPGLLMLDEPIGSLDRTLRTQLLEDLREIIRSAKQTTLYVTHDQEEAFAVADRVVVIRDGQVAQIGTPKQIYQSPDSAFVARFIGLTNLIPGQADGELATTALGAFPLAEPHRGEVLVLLRPDAANLSGNGLRIEGKVVGVGFRGEKSRLKLKVEKGLKLEFEFPADSQLGAVGDRQEIWIDTSQRVETFPAADQD